jgi:hypothetical protein
VLATDRDRVVEFLRGRGQPVRLATYDERMLTAAARLGIPTEGL